jgi:hypothetical protein
MRDRWQERVRKARALKESKGRAYKAALGALEAFESEVDLARTEWALVLAERAMSKSLGAMEGDPMSQLKSRTAITEVTMRMNEAFASLEVELLSSPGSSIGGDAGNDPHTIDVKALELSVPSSLRLLNESVEREAIVR